MIPFVEDRQTAVEITRVETVTSVNETTGITEFNYTNVSSVTISGIEASAEKTFNNGINLHAALAYAYGRNEE
ncbi:hypothetical protein ACC724_40095, partial [Rhizobium ruizarguesonis]